MNHPVRPTVGVVIPVYNDWPRLQQCLKALAGQSYPTASFQVRVVDNGSTDWPANPQFPLPVEVISYPQPGSYGARNRAALDWSVQVLAFTDSDCIPAPDWIEQGVRAFVLGSPQTLLVAGGIALEARSAKRPTVPEQLDQILGFDQARTVRRAGYGVTANLWIPQAAFQALGGFRSHTLSGGDRDFCERATAHGLQLIYAAAVAVRHPARDWPGLLAKQRRIVGGRLALAGASVTRRLGVLLLSLRPVVSEAWRVLCASQLSYGRRLQLLTLVLWLRGAVLLEWLRLQCPGQQSLR